MSSKPRTARHARRWGFGVGMAGAAAAAAMIGVASAPVGRADTPDDVLDQAIQDLAKAAQVFEQAPEASLDAHQIAALTPEENLIATSESFASSLEADQAGLPAADQAGLAEADLAVLQADKGILDAAQGFLAADQAGELASWGSGLPTDFATLDADFGVIGAALNVGVVELGAEFFNALGVPDIFLP
jgi:hypothetical protein